MGDSGIISPMKIPNLKNKSKSELFEIISKLQEENAKISALQEENDALRAIVFGSSSEKLPKMEELQEEDKIFNEAEDLDSTTEEDDDNATANNACNDSSKDNGVDKKVKAKIVPKRTVLPKTLPSWTLAIFKLSAC
jgi:hypothetical protein